MARSADDVVPEAIGRLVAEVTQAVKRRPKTEAKLAGAARCVAPYSAAMRAALVDALDTLVRRASFDRMLYAAAVRSLVELKDKRSCGLLQAALASDDGGGLPALSAACFTRDPNLAQPLARAVGSRHAHLAFASEIARLARGESTGAHLASVAPKIKEAHRIALCVEVFVPLVAAPSLPVAIAPALAVLRDAERHLGRWLVLAEIAVRAGDRQPLDEAMLKATKGPSSSRAAWSLVAWALERARPDLRAGGQAPPEARPTAELAARLSDWPSSDRDTTFLFRLAEARIPAARAMLEALARPLPFDDEVAVRAAKCLVQHYGREDLLPPLRTAARESKRDELRGLATAALWDAGDREGAVTAANELASSKSCGALAWVALVRGATDSLPIVNELRFRRVHLGWVE